MLQDEEIYNREEKIIFNIISKEKYLDDVRKFYKNTIQGFFDDVDDNNRTYSVINVYIAFCMLAEITQNNSRAQLLNLLGTDNIDKIRKNISDIVDELCIDKELIKVLINNSLWLSDTDTYNKDTCKTLEEKYKTSTHSGIMGSEEYNNFFREYLNRQTKKLLKDSIDKLKLDKDTVCALVSTIYFKSSWKDEFKKYNTYKREFYTIDKTIKCDFMNERRTQLYYYNNMFTAIEKEFQEEYKMWFILPNENIDIKDVLVSASKTSVYT